MTPKSRLAPEKLLGGGQPIVTLIHSQVVLAGQDWESRVARHGQIHNSLGYVRLLLALAAIRWIPSLGQLFARSRPGD